MTATTANDRGARPPQGLRHTDPTIPPAILRVVAGLPLFAIGSAHIFVGEAPMGPLVEAAGFPFPSLMAPLAVAAEIVAGVSLLLGMWARIGGLLAVPVMLGAVSAHLVIDVWPNGAENEPPLALPIAVAIAASYVVVRGAGRWSLDQRHARTPTRADPG